MKDNKMVSSSPMNIKMPCPHLNDVNLKERQREVKDVHSQIDSTETYIE